MSKSAVNQYELAPSGALVGFQDLSHAEKSLMCTLFEVVATICPELLDRDEVHFAVEVGGETGHYFYPGVTHQKLVKIPVFTLEGVFEVSTVNCLNYPRTGQTGLVVQAQLESN